MPRKREAGSSRNSPRPEAFPQDLQSQRFSPKFDRLAEVLARDPNGLELRADPNALAPERLLVFEVRGSVANFARAVRQAHLELVDEEELQADEQDKTPVAYLMVPDVVALRQIESLWRRWQRGQLVTGETPWRDVFALLRDLRPWGPNDRVQPRDLTILEGELEGRDNDGEPVRLEVELVFRESDRVADARSQEVTAFVQLRGGRVVASSRIADIAYHALLIDLPVRAVREIVQRSPEGIAGLEAVMHVRPQSIATTVEVSDALGSEAAVEAGELGPPILALLDGVPVGGHPLLSRHLRIDDPFGLEARALVPGRVHGTAMASLIVHGDRNRAEASLPRQIHVVPVLGEADRFPPDRLIVDIIYTAVLAMREGPEATAPGVLIVNLSLGNSRRQFHGHLSPWARLLDRLSYRFGLLFLVSAGNVKDTFGVPAFATRTAFEDAEATDRSHGTLSALGRILADRRLFSPSETLNGLTVGACNVDAVQPNDRLAARTNVDPYPALTMANPSSAHGPGFALSVKPDILMPGSREHLRVVRNDVHVEVNLARASRSAGLKVAAPPRDGQENVDGYTGGTSAATALASRTCHRIHDALEAAYGDRFLQITHLQRAVLLKALLAHPAKWPDDAAALIRAVIGPANKRLHTHQKDNIRRFLGYGLVEADDAVACAADRATFWAVGALAPETAATVTVPVPTAMGGRTQFHAVSATLAWFAPVSPGRKSYRSVKLKILEPAELGPLRLSADSNQPDSNQSGRGTLFKRFWSGGRAPAVTSDMAIDLVVQREPDQGVSIDEAVPFGLAVTVTMPGVLGIYDEVRARPGVAAPVRP